MAAVKELIRAEADGSISFGDYELASKTKKQDFAVFQRVVSLAAREAGGIIGPSKGSAPRKTIRVRRSTI